MSQWTWSSATRQGRTKAAFSSCSLPPELTATCTLMCRASAGSGRRLTPTFAYVCPMRRTTSIMYSVTNRRTLEDAEFVHDNLLTNLMGTTEDIPIVLVGNKCDLDSER